jgi:3-dehydroquinate synthase
VIENRVENLRIKSAFGDYSVSEAADEASLYEYLALLEDAFFLVDSRVYDLVKLGQRLPPDRIFQVEASESSKNLDSVASISSWLASNHADKQSTLVAIGGGIIQDLATFTAAVYFRGIKWIFVPTTLLSMADSCIGAKCALNIPNHKNQVGLIYAPSEVILFQGFLSTLSDELVLSGLGEILKLSLTGPKDFFPTFVEKAQNDDEVFNLVMLSLRSKQAVIEVDELELGLRRILNYGHSFGHAIEAISSGAISHGEAVVFGIDIVNYLGEHWGLTPPGLRSRVSTAIEEIFPKIDWQFDSSLPRRLVEELRHDKKIVRGDLVFAVLRAVGNIELVSKPLDVELIGLVEKYFESESKRFSS